MRKQKIIELDFIIDRLTNSIQNTISGDSFTTEVSLLTKADIKHITNENGWNFNWKSEFDNTAKEVHKLTISNNPTIIQGVICLTIEKDHVFRTYLKVRHLIWAKTNSMKELQET